MAAGRYFFAIEQGATTKFEIQYTDSDANPIDLTGYVLQEGNWVLDVAYDSGNNTTWTPASSTDITVEVYS